MAMLKSALAPIPLRAWMEIDELATRGMKAIASAGNDGRGCLKPPPINRRGGSP